MQTSIKKLTSKCNFFFIANYKPFPIFREFEQLSSSIGWRVMAWGAIHPRLAFPGVEFLPIFVFSAVILDPDILATQSMALKTWITAKIPNKI